MPEYPDDLYEYLSKNINYPKKDRKAGKEGKVVVQFIIELDGSVSNLSIIKSGTKAMDKESLRVISNMGKWKPALINDKPVRFKYTIPINFKLT